MPRRSVALLSLCIALLLTGALFWFAVRNYRSAAPIAEENLRGLALTMAAAMEGVAARDPSLKALASFQTREVAYAALISPEGRLLFHSNPELSGLTVADQRYQSVLSDRNLREERVRLGTGELVYEFQTPFHLDNRICVLRLALHTWRSEAVMRRAAQGATVLFSLLAVGWGLGLTVFWLLRRQAAHERLLAHRNELARLGEVGAVLAHEVRNPLAGIKGYGQLLEERLPEGRERGFATLIVSEADRLETLAGDILHYTRSVPVEAAPCRLAEAAGSVLELLTPQLQQAGVSVRCEIADDLMVLCSEEGLRRVLLNLLANALQASPAEGTITILARRADGWIETSVADQGAGIPPEMRPVLFEPFRTSKARGAGLGLAVCGKIVEQCGGSLTAEDAPGGGALFRLRLPVADGGEK